MKKAGQPKASNYAVMVDELGVHYLRIGAGVAHSLDLIYNDGRKVQILRMPQDAVRRRNLLPVSNGNVVEFARSLYKPIGVNVQVSGPAAEVLQHILSNKEILAMAKVAVKVKGRPAPPPEPEEEEEVVEQAAPARRAGGKGVKVAAPARATKPTAKVAVAANGGERGRFAGQRIRVLNREHGAREGTKRADAMNLLFKCKTTDDAIPRLQEIGADNSFIRYAINAGLIELY